jgi:hypothetical protein
MATGNTRYADISSLVNDIYEGALFTLRERNLLTRTVRVFTDTMSMAPRKNTAYGTANVRQVGEGEDITPTKFDRTLLSTLTPARYSDQFVITDERIATDPLNVRADAAMELGAAFAEYVDKQLVADFNGLTGGTIGTPGGTLTWDNLSDAYVLLVMAKVPRPYWCALHPQQWNRLRKAAGASGVQVAQAPLFQDRLTQDYFVSSLWGDLFFVVTANITQGTAAVGAMYSPLALAYDERTPFTVEPQRDASRGAWELNANLRFAHGVWAAARGVQLIGTAANP